MVKHYLPPIACHLIALHQGFLMLMPMVAFFLARIQEVEVVEAVVHQV